MATTSQQVSVAHLRDLESPTPLRVPERDWKERLHGDIKAVVVHVIAHVGAQDGEMNTAFTLELDEHFNPGAPVALRKTSIAVDSRGNEVEGSGRTISLGGPVRKRSPYANQMPLETQIPPAMYRVQTIMDLAHAAKIDQNGLNGGEEHGLEGASF